MSGIFHGDFDFPQTDVKFVSINIKIALVQPKEKNPAAF